MTKAPLDVHDAVGRDDARLLTELLDGGADPNAADPQYGHTPLSRACFRDRLEIVDLLLQRGAEPNQRLTYRSPVDGRTEEGVVALMFARSAEVVTALLRAGANPNVCDLAGETPLMRAALGAPPAATQVLIDAGAERGHRNQDGLTAADLVLDRLRWHNRDGPISSPKLRRRIADLEHIHAILIDRVD